MFFSISLYVCACVFFKSLYPLVKSPRQEFQLILELPAMYSYLQYLQGHNVNQPEFFSQENAVCRRSLLLYLRCGFGFDADLDSGWITICKWDFTAKDRVNFSLKDVPIPKVSEHKAMCHTVPECSTLCVKPKMENGYTKQLKIKIYWTEYEYIYKVIPVIQRYCQEFKFGYCLEAFGGAYPELCNLPLKNQLMPIKSHKEWENALVHQMMELEMTHPTLAAIDAAELTKAWRCGLVCLRSWQTEVGKKYCKRLRAKYNAPFELDIDDDDFGENGIQLNPWKTSLFEGCDPVTLQKTPLLPDLPTQEAKTCIICAERPPSVVLSCGHSYECEMCYTFDTSNSKTRHECAECRQPYTWYANLEGFVKETVYVKN
jgi:hypothetical protein